MKPRPSLRDLAAELGLSHTTVSLALRRDPRIPAATRQRVEKAARASGYQADATVSILMADNCSRLSCFSDLVTWELSGF